MSEALGCTHTLYSQTCLKRLLKGTKKCGLLKPMGGRPGLPGIAVDSAAAATVAANGGVSTWGFKASGLVTKMNYNEKSILVV